jgi:isoamylase
MNFRPAVIQCLTTVNEPIVRVGAMALRHPTTTAPPVVRPGSPSPLGVTVTRDGANVAVYSSIARTVTLCLFDTAGVETRHDLHRDGDIWHGLVRGMGPGTAYGFRVDGPYDRAAGLLCNPNKLLLDPYAKGITGSVTFGPEVLGHDLDDPNQPSQLDSASHTPRSLVIDPTFHWDRTARPARALADSVIYELHVKGFSALNDSVPEKLRGTYAGLGHQASVAHLRKLGVTAVELLPVHHSVPEAFLVGRGLTNYWGYNTVGFFAPNASYSAAVRAGRPGDQVREFQQMVQALHDAGIEVLLDVVYNHTAEGKADGPTLCFRGLDNPSYYRLDPADPSQYVDTTGCGNSLNAGNRSSLRLLMDSLRYWVEVMGVDGFRFDLASTLARQDGGFDSSAAFFDLVGQDPTLSTVKLVAEPWDVGQADSYDVGQFPPGWGEWNGRFRDTVRDFWRSHDGLLGDLAQRLTGSPDVFAPSHRGPVASVNLVTVHDGFTLNDLVSYDDKHNEANGEDNRDGTSDNRSWNCGVEGPSTDEAVVALRLAQRRAMLTTLLLSAGVPLILAGDEIGRTQNGNNNAYCQDNELAWIDWAAADHQLADYVTRVIAFRQAHPVLRRTNFPTAAEAVRWFAPQGEEMGDEQWSDSTAKAVALVLDGTAEPEEDPGGLPAVDCDVALLVNGWWEPVTFATPWAQGSWQIDLDSLDPTRGGQTPVGEIVIGPRSIVVLTSNSL